MNITAKPALAIIGATAVLGVSHFIVSDIESFVMGASVGWFALWLVSRE